MSKGHMSRRKFYVPELEIKRYYGRQRDLRPSDIILEREYDSRELEEE